MGVTQDQDIPIHRPDKLKKSFLLHARQWQYNGVLFARARGYFNGPFLMPLLWQRVFSDDAIPAVDDVVADLGESSRPWVYQAHCGLIREIHVALYLSYFGTTTKNHHRDVYYGEDLHFKGKPVAIRHAGSFSDFVWSERKAAKSKDCVVLSARSRGSGIHLVPLDDINSALALPILSASV